MFGQAYKCKNVFTIYNWPYSARIEQMKWMLLLFAHTSAGAQFNYTLSKILPFIIISHVLRGFIYLWCECVARWPAMVWCWWRFVVFCANFFFRWLENFRSVVNIFFLFYLSTRNPTKWSGSSVECVNCKVNAMLLAIRTHRLHVSMKLFEFKCPTIMLLTP